MTFEATSETDFGFKFPGMPAMTEGYENENEGLMSLLQLDEEEKELIRWRFTFFFLNDPNPSRLPESYKAAGHS